MIGLRKIVKIVVGIMAIFSSTQISAQALLTSRNTSYYTYVYKLTNTQARVVYKRGIDVATPDFFKNMVDSFPADSVYKKNLSVGHYMYVKAIENQLNLKVESKTNLFVDIVNNGVDLNIMLHDSSGQLIKDARIKLNRKKISFDSQTGTYSLKSNNRQGLLEVQWGNQIVFYTIQRSYNNPSYKKTLNKVLYQSPAKYVVIPISLTINLPFDLYRLVTYRYANGIFYLIKKPFADIFESIDYAEPRGFLEPLFYFFNHKYSSSFKSEIYFSQPTYRKGDTVRFQAFIFDINNKPVTDSLKVQIYTDQYNYYNSSDGLRKTLGYCKPVRPGVFVFDFTLKPEMGFRLDRLYRVELVNSINRNTVVGDFKFEDYELKSSQFMLRSDKSSYLPSQPVVLYCKGEDENNLIIPDARVEITVKTVSVSKYKNNREFVPDILWQHSQLLDPSGETKIEISQNVFPDVDMQVSVTAEFKTSSNEYQRMGITFDRKYDSKELLLKLENDSVVVDFIDNGKSVPTEAKLSIDDKTEKTITLPWKEKINPFNNKYDVYADDYNRKLLLSNELSLVDCLSNRTSDSVLVLIENPRKLPLVYFVYKKDKCIYKGNEGKLRFACNNTTKENYFVSLHYLWAGSIQAEEYKIDFQANELDVKVIEPSVICPGQKAKISLVVTDKAGKPVKGATLLAYGNTKKFGSQFKELPYLGKSYSNRTSYNKFIKQFDFDNLRAGSQLLDWKRYNPRMSLDSIELYKFLYPSKGLYQTTFVAKDSVTQLAPFLVKRGSLAPVNMVYLDGRFLYSDLSNTQQAYSFKAFPGYHKLVIRTREMEIVYDSVYLQKGHKTIISIDLDSVNTRIKYLKRKPWYSYPERVTLNSSLLKISHSSLNSYSYLKQFDHYEIIRPVNYYWGNIAGPFLNSRINFKSFEGFEHTFINEKGYEYEFYPGYYKMKSPSLIVGEKAYLTNKPPSRKFGEFVLSDKDIKGMMNRDLNLKQTNSFSFNNPNVTSLGKATLFVEYKMNPGATYNEIIKNYILISLADTFYSRINNGSESNFYDLMPGEYKIYAVLQNNRFIFEDSIIIRPQGLNYVRINPEVIHDRDIRIEKVNALIVSRLKNLTSQKRITREMAQVQVAKILDTKANEICSYGRKVCGIINDETGQPMVGATITVKGATTVTVSDIDGMFCICVPDSENILEVSFVGYAKQHVNINQDNSPVITLKPDVCKIEEIVVVGYGIQPMSSLIGTMAGVETRSIENALQGKVSGVQISNFAPGGLPDIFIRGAGSINGKEPLIIIDGVPYQGNLRDIDPNEIGNLEILKSVTATALYGAAAANGVILVNKRKSVKRNNITENSFAGIASQEHAIRNQFSDLAFWKPALVTDKNGLVTFEVTFPDDITAWNTYYYAYGAKSTGQAQGQIKAFKPVAATLAVSRFLVIGDVANVIGKALNYTADSVTLETTFMINNKKQSMHHRIQSTAIDTFEVHADNSDTLKITYTLKQNNGFTDGEKREIPVLPLGTRESIGNFWALEGDTSFKVKLDKEAGSFELFADANPLSFVAYELEHIRNYEYLCNEQVASKLKGLLMEKKVFRIIGKEFPYEKDIKRLIKKLQTSKLDNGLWGWWPGTAYSAWISLHVLEALSEAKKQGYEVDYDFQITFRELVIQFDASNSRDKIRILKVLANIDSVNNYADYLQRIETRNLNFTERLEFIELQQACHMHPVVDTLMKWKKETYLGNCYWGESELSLFDDAVSSTLLVYRIFKKDKYHLELLPKMRNYMFEKRGSMYWRNTYESVKVLETILPDIMVNGQIPKAPQLTIKGEVSFDTDKYPLKKTLAADSLLEVSKKGNYPVYLTIWQNVWNSNPKPVDKDFVVKTYFEKCDSVLTAGKPVTMIAEVMVKRASEYVMIEVPIPAGCSYEDKGNYMYGETYREYFKEKTAIFCNYLSEGTYQFRIKLLPRYTGVYNLNPARAELMYFPIMYGRNEIKKVLIN